MDVADNPVQDIETICMDTVGQMQRYLTLNENVRQIYEEKQPAVAPKDLKALIESLPVGTLLTVNFD